jgi:hypothetical protein
LLDNFGLQARVLPESQGLAVVGVTPESQAAAAGIVPGDIIVAADSVTVAAIADVAPPRDGREVTLGLRTAAGPYRRVTCQLGPEGASRSEDQIAAVTIALGALWFILFTAGPGRGYGIAVAQHVTGGSVRLWPQRTAVEGRSPAAMGLAFAAFALCPFAIMALADQNIVLLGGLGLLLSVAATQVGMHRWQRVAAAVRGLLRAVPPTLTLLLGAAGATSMNLKGIVEAQGWAPWHWFANNDPASVALVVLVCATACTGERAQAPLLNALHRSVTGSLVVAALLGGWNSPQANPMVGQLLFAAQSWLVGGCLLVHGARSRLALTAPLAVGCTALSLSSYVAPLPNWLPPALNWSATAATGFVVLPTLVRLVRATIRDTRHRLTSAQRVISHPRVIEDPVLSTPNRFYPGSFPPPPLPENAGTTS